MPIIRIALPTDENMTHSIKTSVLLLPALAGFSISHLEFSLIKTSHGITLHNVTEAMDVCINQG